MATFRSSLTVRRSLASGVRIGSTRPEGTSVQHIALEGGTVAVDITNIDEAPYATIEDPEAARWWIPLVYGDDVAKAVANVMRVDGAEELEVQPQPGPLANAMLRFAKGAWLYRWWPLPDRKDAPILTPDSERLLKAELGVIAWYAGDAFGERGVAEELLGSQVDFILSEAEEGRLAAPRLLALVRAAIDSVAVDEATYIRLERAEERLEQEADSFGPEWSPEVVFSLEEEGVFRSSPPGRVPRLGTRVDERTVQSATVSWGLVPPRTLSSAEGNVTYSVEPRPAAGDISVTVNVTIDPASHYIGDGFYAAIYCGGNTVPVALVDLLEVEDQGVHELTGVATFPPSDGEVKVRIFSEDCLAQASRGQEFADTPAKRDAVVDLLTLIVAIGSMPDQHNGTEPVPSGETQAPYDVDPLDPWYLPS